MEDPKKGTSKAGDNASEQTQKDLQLAQEVLAGSDDAWHRLIEQYGRLIFSVIRQNLFGDEDEIRTVFVDVLERLKQGALAKYEGRALLSTWLVLVVRNQALDQLRKRAGRRELPAVLQRMGERERRIFQLYYWDGLQPEDVLERLESEGLPLSMTELFSRLSEIESQLDARTLRHLFYHAEAASVGAASGRLLEFLDSRDPASQSPPTPLQEMVAREAQTTMARIRLLLDELLEDERRVLTLRFDAGKSAKETAREMGLSSQRKVYTLSDRAIRHLRRRLGLGPGDGDT